MEGCAERGDWRASYRDKYAHCIVRVLSVCVLHKRVSRCACTVDSGEKETAAHTGGGRGGYNIISRVGVV